jgi:hypothetical protein
VLSWGNARAVRGLMRSQRWWPLVRSVRAGRERAARTAKGVAQYAGVARLMEIADGHTDVIQRAHPVPVVSLEFGQKARL